MAQIAAIAGARQQREQYRATGLAQTLPTSAQSSAAAIAASAGRGGGLPSATEIEAAQQSHALERQSHAVSETDRATLHHVLEPFSQHIGGNESKHLNASSSSHRSDLASKWYAELSRLARIEERSDSNHNELGIPSQRLCCNVRWSNSSSSSLEWCTRHCNMSLQLRLVDGPDQTLIPSTSFSCELETITAETIPMDYIQTKIWPVIQSTAASTTRRTTKHT
ncbi:hypothetical protein CAOG_04451 [Capsaspora owczarzaki ATCC 30864]|uniref:Uncharacterized protein n=1 Tax=Capsaspora owczarzaki (strain ATCC 30864) TaxID=595528 RepID=A0A0D2VRX0_CAPO3|nr:hypothetical protein CAOG_04451 [Capsaspora owczarzaki ATCC 30864]KJE93697.1 hypothetical protein CAOG_004451 [Capsaspora owczarzaki ATCC 30864]|eukprot:XP_004348279.2 hypothetical protein CAOG_04451 [Capsaspora owczarzaki ATCC 30864]